MYYVHNNTVVWVKVQEIPIELGVKKVIVSYTKASKMGNVAPTLISWRDFTGYHWENTPEPTLIRNFIPFRPSMLRDHFISY